MRIIPDIKATFGDTHFLGFTERMKYDEVTRKKTDEAERYICRIASSYLKEQIEISVPPTENIKEIGFNQKVTLKGVVFDPYGTTSKESQYAQVVYKCTAEAILSDLPDKGAILRGNEQKPNVK